MPAPSRRTGIPATFIGLALAVILIAGFALGPRAFEFSAWPQPAGDGAVVEVVARPSDEATEVPVARVDHNDRARDLVRDGALSVRGREARRGDRLAARGVTLDARSRGGAGETGSRRGGRGRNGGSETEPPVVVIVDEAPAADPDAPVDRPADQPAQLAEVPPADQVLRPDAGELGEVPDPERKGSRDGLVEVDADRLLDDVDHLIDSLLPGESRRDDRGRGHGRRGHR
jgi:hypothetical protein